MTLNLRIALVGFFLMVSLSGLAHGATVVAIEAPAVFGAPGSVVGWGFTVTADPGIFPLFTGSVFSPDPNSAGTYIDYLALNFVYGLGGTTVSDSFDSSALSGAGEFDIDPLALMGASLQGKLTIFWDEYTVSPGDPAFDPFADLSTPGHSASLAVSVAVGNEAVAVIAPEPVTGWLFLLGMGCLLWKSRRRIPAAPGKLAAAAVVLVCTYAAHAQPIADPNDTYPLSLLRFPDPATGGSTCHTFGDSTKVTGCCGSPGALGCAGQKLLVPIPGGSCTTDPPGNSTRIDGYDHVPYCNLPQASCDPFVNQSIQGSSSTSMSGPQKTTFYFTSDVHFYRGKNYPLEGQVNHVHYLNELFRQNPLWTFQHDFIDPPLGVVIAGDIGTDGSVPDLAAYRVLFEEGTISPGSIRYPVFLGLGNHETVTEVDTLAAHRMWDYLQHRMGSCQVNFDKSSGNYSWDWGRLHLIMLNTWAADTTNLYAKNSPANGLSWLANDLAIRVGTSGRPVVIFQHYEFNGSFYPLNRAVETAPGNPFKACIQSQDQCDSIPTNPRCGAGWTFKNATAFLNTIAQYNVVGIFTGHTHVPSIDAIEKTTWASGTAPALKQGDDGYCDAGNVTFETGKNAVTNSLGVPLDVFTNGTGAAGNTGDFFAVRYSEGSLLGNGATPGMPPFLEVELFHWTPSGITKGLVGNASDGSVGKDFFGGLHACRKAIDTTFRTITSQVNMSVGYNPHPGSNPKAQPAYFVTFTNPAGVVLPSSLAIRVRFPQGGADLTNASFSDRCADSLFSYTAAVPSSAYIPFSASQLGQPIALPFNITGRFAPEQYTVDDIAVDLVAISPLGQIAGPPSVTANIQGSSSTLVPETFTIWGPPNTPFQLNASVSPITTPDGFVVPQNWFTGISATNCPPSVAGKWCFDSNGVATVTVLVSPANFLAQGSGGAAMTINISGQSQLPFSLTVPLVVNAPISASPSSIKLTVGPGSAPTQQVSFTLTGPPGVPFTINASYRTLYPSVTGGQPLPQSWGSRISTNSPGLAFCKQGHPICFGVNGQTQVTIDVDTVELLGLFAPQATVTYLVNSTVTDPANPAYFSLPLTLVVNTNAASRIDVTTPPQPFTPGAYGLIVAKLIEPNSVSPFYFPPPAGQLILLEVTLDSAGNRTKSTALAIGAIDTFCFANPDPHGGTTDDPPNWKFYTVVFGGSYPARNDYCPAASFPGGGPFLMSSFSVGLHHLQVAYSPSNENFLEVASPIFDFVVQPPPGAISAQSGSGQSAVAGSSFAQPLRALVTSASGTPLIGIPVQFTAPATQPSATFGGQTTVSAVTGANGIATSPVLTSGLTPGNFVVTAIAAGIVTPASFNLTNASLPATPLLTATISNKTGPLNARLWTVNVTDQQAAATNVSISSISFTQVAGTACTPLVNTALPIALGNVGAGAAVSAPVAIDFNTCAGSARFTVLIAVQANGGSYTKTTTIGNQFP